MLDKNCTTTSIKVAAYSADAVWLLMNTRHICFR